MTKFIAGIALCVAVLPVWPAVAAQEHAWDCPGSGYLPFRRELLISTEELARLIETSEVTLVHVGSDGSNPRRAAYSDGHLPGARHLKASDLRELGESLRPSLATLGLQSGRRVVLYDTGVGLEAAGAFVALESIGWAEHAALLDGQWSKWVAEGRPLQRFGEESEPADLELRPCAVAISGFDMEKLIAEAARPKPTVTLVDARGGPAEPVPPFLRKPWRAHFAGLYPPMLQSESELRREWASVPARSEHQVVVAARHWKEAAHVYFVARLLGYSARLLDGSIEELPRLTLERE